MRWTGSARAMVLWRVSLPKCRVRVRPSSTTSRGPSASRERWTSLPWYLRIAGRRPRKARVSGPAVVAGGQVYHTKQIGLREGEHEFVRRRVHLAQQDVHHQALLPIEDLGLHAARLAQTVIGTEGGEGRGDALDPVTVAESAAVFADSFDDELLMRLIHVTANDA